MNKLLMNVRGRNHIRFFPMKDTVPDLPGLEADRIRWCEARWSALESSPDAKRLAFFANRKKGYQVSVWKLDGLCYLVQCLRNPWKAYDVTVYLTKDEGDAVSIARFLKENAEEIMSDYRKQLLEARDQLVHDALANPPKPKGLPDA